MAGLALSLIAGAPPFAAAVMAPIWVFFLIATNPFALAVWEATLGVAHLASVLMQLSGPPARP